MNKRTKKIIILTIIGVFLIAVITILSVPTIHNTISWRWDQLKVQIFYALNPPEEAVFSPSTPVQNSSPVPTLTPTTIPATPTSEPVVITPTPVPTATPLPQMVNLTGVKYEDQHGLWNYCAPANLAMALSFWGWEGDRLDTGVYLKPFEKDKNVMPYEMANYVLDETQYKVVVRNGGNLSLLKAILANGFPVIVEKGVILKDLTGKDSWMGHYTVVTGFDDSKGEFITQDSYFSPDYPVSYSELVSEWRSFNYTFIVIYPPALEARLYDALGDFTDETTSDRIAYDLANQEIYSTSGTDQYFAWFNRGTNMVYLQDYAGAAASFDEAFQLYATLPETNRPWRMMWYQTGPYFAYYYAGRYQDVINLATFTIDRANEPYLEESYYWRAKAYVMAGQTQSAITDLQESLRLHPGFQPSLDLAAQLGIQF
jgi:hypothetical protein